MCEQQEKEGDVDTKRLQLLIEDLANHRAYIEKLYTRFFSAGAVLVVIAIGLATWVLGDRIDSAVIDYRIAGVSKDRAEEIINTVKENAIEQASKSAADHAYREATQRFDQEFDESISEIVDKNVGALISRLEQDDPVEAIRPFLLPSKAVIPFASRSCPEGWSAYVPAYGHFIRGIDPTGQIDPDGTRGPGNPQSDAVGPHTHKQNYGNVKGHFNPSGWEMVPHVDRGTAEGVDTSNPSGDSTETRPKNVALLFCEKE